MTEEKSGSGVDQEGSKARTTDPQDASVCEACSLPLSNAENLAGPYCTNPECYRRDAVILPPFNLEVREDALRGILAGYTRVGLESDAARMDWLETQGVVSIYFRDGSQFNPASLSLRAALDLRLTLLGSTPKNA